MLIRSLVWTIDLATGRLVDPVTGFPVPDSGIPRLYRGDLYVISAVFVSVQSTTGTGHGGLTISPVTLPTDLLFRVGVKGAGGYTTGSFFAFSHAVQGETALQAELRMDSLELTAAIGTAASLPCLFEIEGVGDLPHEVSTLAQISVSVVNDIIRGGESMPTPTPADILERLLVRAEDDSVKWLKIITVGGVDAVEIEAGGEVVEPEEVNETLYVRGFDGNAKKIEVAQVGGIDTLTITSVEGAPEPENVNEYLFVRGNDGLVKRIKIVQRDGHDTFQIASGSEAVPVIDSLYVRGADGAPRRVKVLTVGGVDTLQIVKGE